MKISTLLCLLLLVITTAAASDKWPLEPKDFRGVPFGASRDEARAILDPEPSADITKNLNCPEHFISPDNLKLLPPADRASWEQLDRERKQCSQVRDIGLASTTQTFEFRPERFVRVSLTFSGDRFEYLRDIFIQRYGPPTESRVEPFQTRSGSVFQNSVLTWSGDKVTAQIQRFSDTIDKGTAFIADKAWLDADTKTRADAKKKAATTF